MEFKVYDLEINNRAFKAIRQRKKKVEIRVTKIGGDFDYSILKEDDYINFISYDEEKMLCLVKKVNWYRTIEELLIKEGTEFTLSSTNDFDEGVKSINSFEGYAEGMRKNGVYAIHVEPVVD